MTFSRSIDLDRYFARIGWRHAPTVSFDTLAGLLDAHMTHIPFENLDVLLGNPPKLDLPSLQQKLVGDLRGGYCYEHGTLFMAVLEQLGFDVTPHSARVTMQRPKSEAPRTHMFLTVRLDGQTYVLDPGFGGLAPRVPVNIDGSEAGDHQLVREADHHALMVKTPEKLVTAWVTTLERDYPIDFEMANYFTATNPLSPFTRGLMMRAFVPGGKVTIRGRTLTHGDRVSELATGAELRTACREFFGFDLPALDAFQLPA